MEFCGKYEISTMYSLQQVPYLILNNMYTESTIKHYRSLFFSISHLSQLNSNRNSQSFFQNIWGFNCVIEWETRVILP